MKVKLFIIFLLKSKNFSGSKSNTDNKYMYFFQLMFPNIGRNNVGNRTNIVLRDKVF